MGRSVNYLDNAKHVAYINREIEDQDDWEYFEEDIANVIMEMYPSFDHLTGRNKRWDNRETSIILENSHAEIGISEYCGLVSISIQVRQSDYTNENLASHWIDQVWPKIQVVLNKSFTTLKKLGTFSNGESVFEKIK